MNDEMIRRQLQTAADDCFSGVMNMPSQRMAVLKRLEGARRPARRKAAWAPVLAILLTLALAGAALAVGLGLFGRLRMSKVGETDYQRLALLENAAVAVGETAQIGDLGELTIDQAYCDGRRLYYSYTMKRADAEASVYVGDGATLADGRKLPPVNSWTESVGEAAMASYYEVELPQGYAPGETITFTLTVISHREDGAIETHDVQVCVPVTAQSLTMTGEGTADGHPAAAELYVSDVDVSGSVRITAPQDYEPEGYELMVDGTAYQNLDGWWTYDGQAHVLNLRFDLPASLEGARLVPTDPAYVHEAIELE